MNLIDAIKSGRPFRRNNLMSWVFVKDGLLFYNRASDGALCEQPLTVECLTSDDWEIQEPTVTITRTQFWGAFGATLKWWQVESRPKFTMFDQTLQFPGRFGEEMARKLGLGRGRVASWVHPNASR